MSNGASQNPVDWSVLAQSLVRSLSQQHAEDAELSAQVVEVCAAAFASGFARGRWGRVEVAGVPGDLGAGVLLHLIAWSGLAGAQSRDFHNLAEGALATYFATWGATAGKRVSQGAPILPALKLSPSGERAHGSASANGGLPQRDGELLEFIRTIAPN